MIMYEKNQILEVEIIDMSENGEGIGKVDGYTLFVKDSIIGDIVKAGLTKVKKNYAFARTVEIIKPSEYRVSPVCEYHKQCGGCQIMAMSYKAQLNFKESKVKNDLVRIGGFDYDYISSICESIIGMDDPYRYRNKAQYPIGVNKEGDIVAGFYAGRTHSIIANTDCYLGAEENQRILETVIQFMKIYGVKPYDEVTGNGIIRHVLIRKGFITGEIMVCVVINADKLKKADKLVEMLCAIENIKSISININKKNTNVILGDRCETIYGSDTITDYIGDVKFNISPLSFFQVNPIQTKKLYEKALEYADLSGDETVWDLYCGIGTISLFLANKAKYVYGIEIVPQAIKDAKENAQMNNIGNASFYTGAAEDLAPMLLSGELKALSEEEVNSMPDVIVVDPPRKGCDEKLLSTILSVLPEKVVYVSCDPATLSRDLKILCADGNYVLEKVCPVDQFPHTMHVETCVLLSRETCRRPDAKIKIDIDLDDYYAIKNRETK